jgi:hypothetical protein
MYFAEITTDPQLHHRRSNYVSTVARRKNGDHVHILGQHKQQVFAIRRILMKLARKYALPMIHLADFTGLQGIATNNDELVKCLSEVPDAYAEVDMHAAVVAWKRDRNICDLILRHDPDCVQLIAVSNNEIDWATYFRCNCPVPAIREHLAQELAEAQALRAEAVERAERQLARKQANGQTH